jgi:hypothetical protein
MKHFLLQQKKEWDSKNSYCVITEAAPVSYTPEIV